MPGGGEYDSSLFAVELFSPSYLQENFASQPVGAQSAMKIFVSHYLYHQQNPCSQIHCLFNENVRYQMARTIMISAPSFLYRDLLTPTATNSSPCSNGR